MFEAQLSTHWKRWTVRPYGIELLKYHTNVATIFILCNVGQDWPFQWLEIRCTYILPNPCTKHTKHNTVLVTILSISPRGTNLTTVHI